MNYEMYTTAGNRRVETLVNRMIKNSGKLNTIEKLSKFVDDGMAKIAVRYGEVHDTEPRNHIHDAAERVAKLHGFEY